MARLCHWAHLPKRGTVVVVVVVVVVVLVDVGVVCIGDVVTLSVEGVALLVPQATIKTIERQILKSFRINRLLGLGILTEREPSYRSEGNQASAEASRFLRSCS